MGEDCVLRVDAALYPDVAEHGGLAQALAAVAAGEGGRLGEIIAGGPQRLVTATVVCERGKVTITSMVDRRAFSIRIVVDGRDWATGGVDSLAEVVGVAAAWCGGATLRQLCAAFPFMTTDRIALGFEAGNPLDAYWDSHLADADLADVRPLLLAARHHPRLSKLFPGVSHLTLIRLRLDDQDRERGEVRIQLLPDGRYEVDSSWMNHPSPAVSIDDAIALAVAQLPAPPSSREKN